MENFPFPEFAADAEFISTEDIVGLCRAGDRCRLTTRFEHDKAIFQNLSDGRFYVISLEDATQAFRLAKPSPYAHWLVDNGTNLTYQRSYAMALYMVIQYKTDARLLRADQFGEITEHPLTTLMFKQYQWVYCIFSSLQYLNHLWDKPWTHCCTSSIDVENFKHIAFAAYASARNSNDRILSNVFFTDEHGYSLAKLITPQITLLN